MFDTPATFKCILLIQNHSTIDSFSIATRLESLCVEVSPVVLQATTHFSPCCSSNWSRKCLEKDIVYTATSQTMHCKVDHAINHSHTKLNWPAASQHFSMVVQTLLASCGIELWPPSTSSTPTHTARCRSLGCSDDILWPGRCHHCWHSHWLHQVVQNSCRGDS